MRRCAKVCILAGMLGSPLAIACIAPPAEEATYSSLPSRFDVSCPPDFDLETQDVFEQTSPFTLSTEEKVDQDYWAHWLNGEEGNPILSNSAASNHFGVGVWIPEDLAEQLRDMDAKHWIRSHGLQLSLGFGDKEAGTPRVRFDYRWHQQYDGDFLMQFEVPF